MKYYPVIGLEVHIELNTDSKMFCDCPNEINPVPNTNICPACAGHPGTLPLTNEAAVLKTIKTGLSLNCEFPIISKFDRKNYFYPDLPNGYQTSQYDQPLCLGGFLTINKEKIRIRRIHLEEDAGKLTHFETSSEVDFNRAGVPLMELVTEPDIRTAKNARLFLEELRLILQYIGVSEADMEKGQLRADANISIASLEDNEEFSENKMGAKVEIKNLNSFKAIERSLDYEINRQTELLKLNKKIIQETRGWDEELEETYSQREKGDANDYRYFPESNLPPINLKAINIQALKGQIPELPNDRRKRMKKEYGLSNEEVNFFVINRDLGDYYEKATSELENWFKEADLKQGIAKDELFKALKILANYTISDLQGLLMGESVKSEKFLITPENFAELILLLYKKEISSKVAKIVLKEMFNGGDPSNIIKEKNLVEIKEESEIIQIVEDVIKENSKAVEDYKQGKEASFNFLIGQVMAKSKGRANLDAVKKIIKDKM